MNTTSFLQWYHCCIKKMTQFVRKVNFDPSLCVFSKHRCEAAGFSCLGTRFSVLPLTFSNRSNKHCITKTSPVQETGTHWKYIKETKVYFLFLQRISVNTPNAQPKPLSEGRGNNIKHVKTIEASDLPSDSQGINPQLRNWGGCWEEAGALSIDSQVSGHVGHAQGSHYDCYLSARTPELGSKGLEMDFHDCWRTVT